MQIFRKYRGIIPPGVLKTQGHLEICEVHRADKFVRPMCSKKIDKSYCLGKYVDKKIDN